MKDNTYLLSLNNDAGDSSIIVEDEKKVATEGDFREIFSYENLKKEISMIQDMRETIEGQREMIE